MRWSSFFIPLNATYKNLFFEFVEKKWKSFFFYFTKSYIS